MKSYGIVRRVDRVGRVVLPKELRCRLGLGIRDFVAISTDGKRILLEKYDLSYMPACEICGSRDELVDYCGKKVCQRCIDTVKSMRL